MEPHGAAMLRVTVVEWAPPPPPPPPPTPPCPPIAAKEFLHGDICQPPVIGGGGAAKGSAAACLCWCRSDPACRYASYENASSRWCIRYAACAPCSATSGCGDCSRYTTYEMPAAGAPALGV